MAQLTLFDNEQPENPKLIPIETALEFGFNLQFHEIDGVNWYSVQDWISGVSGVDVFKAQDTWRKLQKTLRISNPHLNIATLDYEFRGNVSQSDFTDENGLYLIAQNLRSTKTRPILETVKQFLANAGVFVSKARVNPESAIEEIETYQVRNYRKLGKTQQWIEKRLEGKVSRQAFTDAIKAHVLNPDFGTLTDAEYTALFSQNSEQLKRNNGGLKARDGMTREALGIVGTAESAIARLLGDAEYLTMQEAISVVRQVCKLLEPSVMALNALLGINIATGQKLLK